ncbi:hypothetical protein PIB30_029136 [Stylosanthes scabra]|uniref:RRM domain-containing protein n=1 Tax=Stylosanthes scabra TaxID=79078 RepID=A0ABU6WC86_9FABA|nr:hypothetical protein [Stylosanthes scabra]
MDWQIQSSRRNRSFNRKEQEWNEIERMSHTVFVDGLPNDIAKVSLYRIFWWAGNVVDIYVSRKKRNKSNRPFAFVRFDARGGVVRVVEKLNGTFVGTARMTVKHATFLRQENASKVYQEKENDGMMGMQPETKEMETGRKSIEVTADPTLMDILKQSVVAESIETIRFGLVKEQIAEKWEGPGEVECRDLGPFKCLLTFESVEARKKVYEVKD